VGLRIREPETWSVARISTSAKPSAGDVLLADGMVRKRPTPAEDEAVQSHRPFAGQAANACFCNGPVVVNPFLRFVTAGSCFCTGSALGCRLMVFEEERAGPILDARGCPGFSPNTSCRHCGLTQSVVPAGTPLREGWCYPARKPLSASPVRLNGVSPPRPTFSKAPRAVAVNIGRRPPP
jgi:hypothetical protein